MSERKITHTSIHLGASLRRQIQLGTGYAICTQTYDDGHQEQFHAKLLLSQHSGEAPYAATALEALKELEQDAGQIEIICQHKNFILEQTEWQKSRVRGPWISSNKKQIANKVVLEDLSKLNREKQVTYTLAVEARDITLCEEAKRNARSICQLAASKNITVKELSRPDC